MEISGGKMQRDLVPFGDSGGPIVHWAGRVTDEVFSFLGPATTTLSRHGLAQTVVLFDEPRYRHLLSRFEGTVSLVVTPRNANPYVMWKRARDLFQGALQDVRPSAIHLHGFLPYLLGAGVCGREGQGARVYYSPHGSKSLNALRGIGSALLWGRQSLSGDFDERDIANIPTEAQVLRSVTKSPVTLVESAVAPLFFDVARQEADRPLVLTANRVADQGSAFVFSRLAVLMSEADLRLSFEWIGSSDQESENRLRAVDVRLTDITDDEARAKRLATAWVYVAPAGKSGFPVFLAEAMAVGLACVAYDTPYHRDLIEHGVTGLLCRDEEEMAEHIARLVDSDVLRAILGAAARREAGHRFSPQRFFSALCRSYGLIPLFDDGSQPWRALDRGDADLEPGNPTGSVAQL